MIYKKIFQMRLKKIKEAIINYMGENDLKILKTEFPEKWKYLTKKLAYPYEFFNCLDDYQKPFNNSQK